LFLWKTKGLVSAISPPKQLKKAAEKLSVGLTQRKLRRDEPGVELMKKLNLPNDEIRDLYLSKMMSTVQIAKIFGCNPSTILERLKDMNVKIRGGRHHVKKFFPKSIRIPNSQEKLAYFGGIIDSEGTVGFILNKKRSQDKVAPRLKVGNTDYKLITWLTSELGGRVYTRNERGRHKPCYEWFVSGVQNIQPLLKAILPYLVIKREKAKEVLKFCQKEVEKRGGARVVSLPNSSVECEKIAKMDEPNFSKYRNQQNIVKRGRRRMKLIRIPSSLGLAYVAGVIDGDGSIDFIINKKRRREKVAPRVRVMNTDPKLIRWLENEIGGYVGGVVVNGRISPVTSG